MYRIPLTQTTLGPEEELAAVRVLRRGWVTMGEEVAGFEREFAEAVGAREAVAVSNGTVALELAYEAVGIGPGDEVILPAITFVAALNAVLRRGAVPVLADVTSPDDLTICPASVEARCTARTRMIVPMAFGGHAPAMEELEALCRGRGLVMVEDACHAPLASLNGRPIGTFGAAAAWSFFGNKNMTTGEGGMITTGDAAVAARCRSLRSHGMTRMTWERAHGQGFSYDVEAVGTNARMDEIRAAIGRAQLAKLAGATARRAEAAAWLRAALEAAAIPGLGIPFAAPRGVAAYHVFVVLLPAAVPRGAVMEALRLDGIQTSIHYPPLYGFTAGAHVFAGGTGPGELPVTHAVADRILTLPLGPASTREQCTEVAASLARALQR